MAEIRINATGGVKLYDADDSHYAQIIAGTITANVDLLTLNSAGITVLDGAIDFDIASHDTSNGLKLGGTLVTATAAELNIMDGVTSTAAELNIMDGVTSTAAEINLIDGGTARGTTALADGDGILINDAGTMRMTNVTTVKTYMGGGDNTPYFHVYKSANQTISDATFTTVTFDSEEYDSGSDFASNTFTAPSTGYYYIYSQLVWDGSTDSNYSLNRLMRNASPVNWNAFFQTSNSGGYGGRILSMSASDTITIQCYQDSGGDLDLRGSTVDECQFGGFKLIT